MIPEIFNLLFKDDRQFVMEITPITVNGLPKWGVVTRRNVPHYPIIRSDHFETRSDAENFYKLLVVETPLVSLNGKSPEPKKTLEEYKTWLIEKGLKDRDLKI